MKYVFGFIKFAFMTVAILVASQIPVKGRRICDHVANITNSSAIQKPISVISSNIDFTNGKGRLQKAPARSNDTKTETETNSN